MRVVIVSAVFPPEPVVSAQTSSQIAQELSCLGHSVRVFAPFPNRPRGRLADGYARRLYTTCAADGGYVLTHCFSTFSKSSMMVSRFGENLSFGISSGIRMLLGQRPDVIFSNSWPIFATGIVAMIAKLRRIPLVLSVQDMYPESLDSQGRTTHRGWLYRLLRQCDIVISRSAKQIIVISPGFRQLYVNDRGISVERVHVVPNWGSEDLFQRDTHAAFSFRQKLGIPKAAFMAVYAGNVGVASNAEMLVDVHAKLQDRSQIYLVIAGDGSRLAACRAAVERQRLDRACIHSPWKTEETSAVLQMADVLLLPTKGRQSLISIPSKLIAYFLAGRPVIAAVLPESVTGKIIMESGAGWVVSPDSADSIAHVIAVASELSRETLRQMGDAGREYALRNFMRESNLPRIIEIVEKAAGPKSGGSKKQQEEQLCQ